MTAALTENLHERAEGLDELPLQEVAAILAEAQVHAASAVRASTAAICGGAAAMARAVRNGGRIHYVAAGSSGLMAAADAQELGGTFSIPASQLRIHMAGGLPTGVEMPGGTEDDTAGLMLALTDLTSDDVVIAVSASGSTPFTTAAAQIALRQKAVVIGIANNAGSELLEMADHPILLETPPEVLSGSTRMGAGTAQKIALNVLSTLMAVELGHIHDGMMVNLHADNKKLRQRANGIVQKIAGVTEQAATQALEAAGGDVKVAVLVASNDMSQEVAVKLLEQTDGHLRTALERSGNT